jgi:prepilin-type N-terminal cleavage/methylation domain-containing protein
MEAGMPTGTHRMQTMTTPTDKTTQAAKTTQTAESRGPTRTRRLQRRAGERGFSFIEILIVMGIIGVLVGGIVVAIGIWARKGPEFATKNTLNKTKLMIENWKQVFESYPPSDVTRIATVAGGGKTAAAPGNKYNSGIESIYQALYWPGFKSDPEWSEEELSNIDEDSLRKAINKYDKSELMEIKDAFGNPLIYFHRDDYVRAFEGGGVPFQNSMGDDFSAMPFKREDGTFYNPSSFQIYSAGPDGEPNTDDDITTWGE